MKKNGVQFNMGKPYDPPEQFKSIITSTVEKLLRASHSSYDESDGWEFIREKNGVVMHRKRSQKVKGERTIHTVRGRGHVRCGAEAFRDLVIDLGNRRRMWDSYFKSGKVVELLDEKTGVVWLELQTKKCVMDFHRDLLYLQHSRELGDGVFIVASRSAGVQQTLVTSPEGCLRGELHASGYVIRPLQDELGTCEVTYVVQADMGQMPTTILNKVAEDQPQCIYRQRIVYAEIYGGGSGSISEPLTATDGTEERESSEEVPESGNFGIDSGSLPDDIDSSSPTLPPSPRAQSVGWVKTPSLRDSSASIKIGMVRNNSSGSPLSSPRREHTAMSPPPSLSRLNTAPPLSPRGERPLPSPRSPRVREEDQASSPRLSSSKPLPTPPSPRMSDKSVSDPIPSPLPSPRGAAPRPPQRNL